MRLEKEKYLWGLRGYDNSDSKNIQKREKKDWLQQPVAAILTEIISGQTEKQQKKQQFKSRKENNCMDTSSENLR